MGASKGSPATQVLEWAVAKLDEASKTDWLGKLSSMTSSRPAYLRNGVTTPSAPSLPAAVPSGGAGQAELDAALTRAAQAEAWANSLTRKVAQLEHQLAATKTHPQEVLLPDEEALAGDDEENHKHWWSRKH